jgi:hypothetical protein
MIFFYNISTAQRVNYAVGHPLLAFLIKVFANEQTAQYSIGVLNFILIIQLIITGRLILFILKELKINSTLSVFGAISIAFLAPQIFRLDTHPSLAYSMCIPTFNL